jgi:hypothetical protein
MGTPHPPTSDYARASANRIIDELACIAVPAGT